MKQIHVSDPGNHTRAQLRRIVRDMKRNHEIGANMSDCIRRLVNDEVAARFGTAPGDVELEREKNMEATK